MIAAQQYFVEYGNSLIPERLQTLLGSYIPDAYLQKPNAAENWMKGIISKLRSPYFSNERIKPEKVSFVAWSCLIIQLLDAFLMGGVVLNRHNH